MPRADDEEAVSWAVEATKHGKSAQFDFEKLLADVNNALESRQHIKKPRIDIRGDLRSVLRDIMGLTA